MSLAGCLQGGVSTIEAFRIPTSPSSYDPQRAPKAVLEASDTLQRGPSEAPAAPPRGSKKPPRGPEEASESHLKSMQRKPENQAINNEINMHFRRSARISWAGAGPPPSGASGAAPHAREEGCRAR